MTNIWKMAVAVAVVLGIAVHPGCVYACRCRPPEPPAQALADATAVFAGQASTVDAPANQGGAEPVEVTFAVSRSWKGVDQSTLVLTTPASSASCGFEFVQGQEYLVYASESEGALQTIACSRTAPLASAGEDLAALGVGNVPGATEGSAGLPSALPATGTPSDDVPWIAAVVGLLLTVLGAAVRRRGQRSAYVSARPARRSRPLQR